MRVYIDVGYHARGVAEVTPAELETFCRVLDKVQASKDWYGHDRTIALHGGVDARIIYRVTMVPASINLQPPAVEATPAEEK